MRHSCDPKVECFFDPTSFNTVRALKPIKTGEEITISYRVTYYEFPNLSERQGLLSKRFFLKCNCCECSFEAEILNELSATQLRTFYPVACQKCKRVITSKRFNENDHHSRPTSKFTCTGCNPPNDVELKELLLSYQKVSNLLQICKKSLSKIEEIASSKRSKDQSQKVYKTSKENDLKEEMFKIEDCVNNLRSILVWRESVHLYSLYRDLATKCALIKDWANAEKYFTFCIQIFENTIGCHNIDYSLDLITLAEIKTAVYKANPHLKGLARNCLVYCEKALNMISTLPIITQKKVEGNEDYIICKKIELQERAEGLKKILV